MRFSDYEQHHLPTYVHKRTDIYDKNEIDNKLLVIQNSITTAIANLKQQIIADLQVHEAKILTQMLNFRNGQVKNRLRRKKLTLPRTPNQWILLLDVNDVGDGATDLADISIISIWTRRWDRFHKAYSELVESAFGSTEFFFNKDQNAFYMYYSTMPQGWNMSAYIEYVKIPQTISVSGNNKQPGN